MAEGDIDIYQEFKKGLFDGHYDLVADVVVALLVTGYTPDLEGDTLLADVSGYEISDPSYSRQTLTGKTVVAVGGTTQSMFDADNVTFVGLEGPDPSHLILFDDTATSPLDPLICVMELATSSNGGDYIISWNATGIIRIS